jgi:hypothetical protein
MAKGCFLHTYTKSMTPASHGEESVNIILDWDSSGEASQCTVFGQQFPQVSDSLSVTRECQVIGFKLFCHKSWLFLHWMFDFSRQQVFVGSLVD